MSDPNQKSGLKALPKWAPYLVFIVVCLVVAVALFIAAILGNNKAAVVDAVDVDSGTSQEAPALPSTFYLIGIDGKVALYQGEPQGNHEQIEVTDLSVIDLEEDEIADIADGIIFTSEAEARTSLDAMSTAAAERIAASNAAIDNVVSGEPDLQHTYINDVETAAAEVKAQLDEVLNDKANGALTSTTPKPGVTVWSKRSSMLYLVEIEAGTDGIQYHREYLYDYNGIGRVRYAHIEGKDSHEVFFALGYFSAFRWSYTADANSGQTINYDNDFDNPDFIKWEKFATGEIAPYFSMR